MNRSVVQRIIPFIFIIVVIGLIIAALFAVVRVVFNTDTPAPTLNDSSASSLVSTTSERKVRMTVRGPIVGNEEFRSYQVTVTPDSRDFVRYQGYLEKSIGSKHYSNNVKAYGEFVNALAKANLAQGTPLTGAADDTTGVCATGQIHEYEIMNGDSVVKRLWTSTCGEAKGSLAADDNLLRQLFLAQVPAAPNIIGGGNHFQSPLQRLGN